MSLADGQLRLSNGRGNMPLSLDWRWDLPQTMVIHWTGTEYEALATYKQEQPVALLAANCLPSGRHEPTRYAAPSGGPGLALVPVLLL
jgi:hypothetical protein